MATSFSTTAPSRAILHHAVAAVSLSSGALTLTNSTISNNTASGSNNGGGGGGGIELGGRYETVLSLTNSTISGNNAANEGGGINAESYDGGDVSVTNSTISGNFARQGGGVAIGYGTRLVLTNSTVSGNTARLNGGGVLAGNLGRATLTNSTVTGNSANSGGGVYVASTATLNRTLISGNTASNAPEVYVNASSQYSYGRINAANFNLFGQNSNAGVVGFSPGASDIVPSQSTGAILNTTLATNGGTTSNHALVSGSQAVDAITNGCPPPSTDQRGMTRPQDGNRDGSATCDIGSFELTTTPQTTETCGGVSATIVGTARR